MVICMSKKLNGTVIVTYRCNARCNMCNRYKAPSKPEEEISLETIRKLPPMYFTNITGGEPFIRTDLKDIVRELYKKSDRIVISTNGFFTDRIIDLCKEFPDIGIRISIEGLEATNNEIRGLEALTKKVGYVISQALGLNAKIKLVEPQTLKRSEGKAVHVIDNRKLY